MGSDHNPLMIKMNIKLKKLQKKQMNHHMELNLLKHDEYKIMYAIEVKNQYETLSEEETDEGSDLEVVERRAYMADTENKYGASCKESSSKER